MDDFRKITYGVIVGFVVMLVFWISFLTFTGCGSSLNCAGAAPTVERTSIPTLIPATLPPLNRALGPAKVAAASGPAQTQPAEAVARPSNAGGPGPAIDLTGDVNAGKQVFAANCETCHGAQGIGGVPNPGSSDGTIPPLNPIDPTLQDADRRTYATNLDLFIEHGSTPAGPNPTRSMLPWGDKGLLTSQQIADVIAYAMSLNPVSPSAAARPTAAATSAAGTQPAATQEIARPSNPGGAGPAIGLTGDVNSGMQLFAANCETCHGAKGVGGVPNPGSSDGTIPPLNPIDPTLQDPDRKTYATNLDLFIEHGSTPAGPNPTRSMLPWGDKGLLTPQQIADVIAYVMSLNPVGAAAAPAIARPSNAGGPGPAMNLMGDANAGQQVFGANCETCHGAQGIGGVPNPGSSDGTIPPLSPIDSTLKNPDYKTFATNLDLFIEHGSTPAGPNPTRSMLPWGDKALLTPQQIADVIAYVISLNK